MQIYDSLEKLASTAYWQNLYAQSKKVNGIKLFNNENDFSLIQILFLQYLEVYHQLWMDVLDGKLDEKILKDPLRVEAYLFNKKRKQKYELKNKKIDNELGKSTFRKPTKEIKFVVLPKKKVKK